MYVSYMKVDVFTAFLNISDMCEADTGLYIHHIYCVQLHIRPYIRFVYYLSVKHPTRAEYDLWIDI